MATASEGAPGKVLLGIIGKMAGRGGRVSGLGFKDLMATAKGAPGTPTLGTKDKSAGRAVAMV